MGSKSRCCASEALVKLKGAAGTSDSRSSLITCCLCDTGAGFQKEPLLDMVNDGQVARDGRTCVPPFATHDHRQHSVR